jgi:hypothetical protein
MMKRSYLVGAIAVLAGAVAMVAQQAGSTARERFSSVADYAGVAMEGMVPAGGGGLVALAPDRAPDRARGSAPEVAPAVAAAPEPVPVEEALEIDSTGPSDTEMLLAETSPWTGNVRRSWSRGGATPPAVAPGLEMVGQDSNGYPLAGAINAGRGGDALAAALSQPVMIGAVPEPASWISMIVGLGMVGYAMRRRNRVPRVSS